MNFNSFDGANIIHSIRAINMKEISLNLCFNVTVTGIKGDY